MKKIYLTLAALITASCSQYNNTTSIPDNTSSTLSNNLKGYDVILNKTRELAKNDPYLTITQRLQCNELAPNGKTYKSLSSKENVIIEPYQVFDNLYYIGGTRTGSWLITTTDGYMMIDAMYGDSPESALIPGMRKLGLAPEKLKYILITHAGPDHAGGAKYFQEKYGTRIIMSQQDWDGLLKPKVGSWVLNKNPPHLKPAPERTWDGAPVLDIVAAEQDSLTLGSTTLDMYFTPRRANGGGLSFVLPVFDQGKKYTWATYGNAGQPRSEADKHLHMKSLNSFLDVMKKEKVSAITSSHPFVDGSDIRAKALVNRKPSDKNPFIIGGQSAKKYIQILEQCTALSMAPKEV